MNRIRVTEGKYVGSGERFRLVDDFLQRSNAHRLLCGSWIGRTTFHEAPGDYVEDAVRQKKDGRGRTAWADMTDSDEHPEDGAEDNGTVADPNFD